MLLTYVCITFVQQLCCYYKKTLGNFYKFIVGILIVYKNYKNGYQFNYVYEINVSNYL